MSFKAINYLLFSKRKKELNNELLAEFSPWLTTKSFSFYEKGVMVDYINDTLNLYANVFTTKEDQFKFFEAMIPIQSNKRGISYIKTPKIEKGDEIPHNEFY